MANFPIKLAALLLCAAPLSAGTKYQVTISGIVEYNQIGSGFLGTVQANEGVVLSFRLDAENFLNSPNFPTRGYFIESPTWSLQFDSGSLNLQNPYSGFGAMFVLRNNDPAVDGFLVSDNVDNPFGVPLAQNGSFGAFDHSFMATYPGNFLPSLNIADAVGSYDFTGLSVFNWTIDDGPFNPLGMIFDEIKIEAIPLVSDIESLSLSSGGTQVMALNSGPGAANHFHWMFGSVTGTSPGLDLPGGLNLPLNFDVYLNLTLTKPNLGAFGNFFGQLNGDGKASATLTLPPGLDPGLAGVTFNHAYLSAAVLGVPDFASNAVSFVLTP
jgi:hypothetical protein